jgi:phage minor structural protein
LLYIFSRQDEKLLAVLSNDNPKSCPYFEAPHTEKLNGENTFDFSVPFSHEDSVYVVEENLVAFKDLDNNYQLFTIRQVEETHDEQKVKIAYCEFAATELIDEIVTDLRPANVSAGFALTEVLQGTRWQMGTVDDFGLNSSNFYYINVLSSAFQIATVWGGEVVFRVTISGQSITGRYVDIIARRGNTTGKRFEYSKDIKTIKRKVDLSNLKTALYGRGKGCKP